MWPSTYRQTADNKANAAAAGEHHEEAERARRVCWGAVATLQTLAGECLSGQVIAGPVPRGREGASRTGFWEESIRQREEQVPRPEGGGERGPLRDSREARGADAGGGDGEGIGGWRAPEKGFGVCLPVRREPSGSDLRFQRLARIR